MQMLARIVRAVAVAAIVNSVLACSDVKIFLAQPAVKQQGVRITREAALDVPSNLVKLDLLGAIADEANEYFDFDPKAFDGSCQVSSEAACALKKCGCPGTSLGRRLQFFNGNILTFPITGSSSSKSSNQGNNSLTRKKSGRICFFYCSITGRKLLASNGTTSNTETSADDETILAVCFGNKCKGFSLSSKVFAEEREKSCSLTQRDDASGK